GAEVSSEDEFHGKSFTGDTLIAEGVEGLVPCNGTVEQLVSQMIGGVTSGMYYIGAKTIPELWEKAKFMKITQASLVESHPHDLLITNPGDNYN
ncbi:MAG: IMP dehydrogenase, partial [Candidatus Saccharimonadaceae bacterium]